MRCPYALDSQRLPSVSAGSAAEAVAGCQEEDMASAAEPRTFKDALIRAADPARDGARFVVCP